MSPMRSLSLLFLPVLAIAITASLHAQTTTASVGGTIKDMTGAAVPNAIVRVANEETGREFQVSSSSQGDFLVTALPPGRYTVAVEAPGFKKLQRSSLTLEVNQVLRLDLGLELGTLTETVEVSAAAQLLETATSAGGQVITNRNITNLPLNARNPYALVLLVPGVHGNIGFRFNEVNFSVNGGRPGSNEILLDGIPSAPPLVNPIQGFAVFPSVDAVQEFRVQSNNYSAEFGRSGGSIVNLVYKSGTNNLHGSLFEFLRNSRLDSNNFFSNARGIPLGSFRRNQFGASVGGPVVLPRLYNGRNRTFFHFTYEGLRQSVARTLLTTVPTELQRAGDFSQTRNAAGALVVIYDPQTTGTVGNVLTRQPFLGNRIPADRIDPVAARVMQYFPKPTGPGDPNSGTNNFAAQGSERTGINQTDIKVDENINDSHRFFVRASWRNYTTTPADFFPSDVLIAQADGAQPQQSSGAAVQYTWTATPTNVLEFRGGFARVTPQFLPRSDGFDPTQLGFPSYIAANADRAVFPRFAATGYTAIGNGGSTWRNNAHQTLNFSVNNSKITSKHWLKFGFEGRVLRVNVFEAGNPSGNFTFTRNLTQGPDPNRASTVAGDAIASMLLGAGTGVYTRKFKDAASQSTYYALYFADDWKVTPKLTLNLGLRYELDVPRTERYDRMNYFDPLIASPLAQQTGLGDLRGGLVFVGVDGRPRSEFLLDRNNWAPRFGFAYQAMQRLVLRGAYGIFYSPSPTAAAGTVGRFGFSSDTEFIAAPDGLRPINRLSDPFPNGMAPIAGSDARLLTGVGSPITAPLRHTVVPYTQNWSFNIQYELPRGLLVETGYVGSRGIQLNASGENTTNLNQLRPETLQLGTQLQQSVANPFYGMVTTGPLAARTVPRSFLERPFPQFTTISPLYMSGASSTYHSMQFKADKRFSAGMSFMVAYTLAKLIDDFSFISNVGRNANQQNIYDRRSERAVSPNDVAQRFVTSLVYELPFGRARRFGSSLPGVLDILVGGWQVNGILTLQGGQPLTLTTTNTSNSGSAVLRPNNNGRSARLSGSVHDRLHRYFDTSVFSQPEPFTFGNTGRTLPDVRSHGLRNLDFSLFKNFRVTEKATVQFRAEAFNLTNTPQFGFPDMNFASQQFGVISSQANEPRQIQFGLKVLF
jgi:hypothetical protein